MSDSIMGAVIGILVIVLFITALVVWASL